MELFFTILGVTALAVLCACGVLFIAAGVIAYYDMIDNENDTEQ